MQAKLTFKKTAILGAAILLTASCGGKKKSSSSTSSDGSASPTEDALVTLATGSLQLASDVTIIKGSDASGTSLVSLKLLATDHTVQLRVNNEAFEDVQKAGEIMCMLGQTKFWEQANAGIYQAQIDQKLCDKSGDSGGDPSQGGGSDQSPELQVVYVNSVREENKPLIAEMRVAAGEGKDNAYYHVKAIIVEPPSSTAPAGIFDMHYTAHMGTETGETGFIRTKRIGADKFVLETGSSGKDGGGGTSKSQGIAEIQIVDENTSTGYVHSDSSGTYDTQSYTSKGQARFNANYMNVDYTTSHTSPEHSETSPLVGCYDLKKFKTAMFQYDLEDEAGKTVTLNSGFPVEMTSDGSTIHGWAGYYGLWLGNETPTNGATVNRVTWGNGGAKTSVPYTVFAAPGKLTKLTKATTTLAALKGADLYWYDSGNQYIVKWDGTSLTKTAKVTNGNNGPEESAITGDATVTIPQWGLGLWVPNLNANIQISKAVTLSDSLTVSYHSESTASGTADVPTCQLKCFQNCPVMAPAAADFQMSQGGMTQGPMVSALYHKATVTWPGSNQSFDSNQVQTIASVMATYSWNATTQNLVESSTEFALPSGLSSGSNNNGGGSQMQNIWSGALVCADAYTAITDKTIDPYRMENSLDTFYRFSSGAQTWNRFITLKDSAGTIASFDKPLEISYTHTTANDWDGNTDTSFIGKTFRLQYQGPGQLQGIPWKQSKDVGHFMPLFSIKAGVKAGVYTIYPKFGEQRLATTEAANCADIPLDSAPTLPELDGKVIDVGELGDTTSPLRYISGEAVE